MAARYEGKGRKVGHVEAESYCLAPLYGDLSPSPDHIPLNRDTDSETSEIYGQKESPLNIPTPDSDLAENHPPCASEDYTSYSQLILRIAKVMDLSVSLCWRR